MSNEAVVVPAEVPASLAAPENTSGENASESATGNDEQPNADQRPKGGGFQRRIDKLTREKSDAQREAEYWRNAALQHKPADTPRGTPKADEKPNADDFDTHDTYVEAVADWKVRNILKENEGKAKVLEAQRERQTVAQKYTEREEAFRESTPDYMDVVEDARDLITGSPALLEEVINHEHGPQLAYFLGQNPDVAERLANLSPAAVAREIGRLESKFVPAEAAAKDRSQTVSKAPKPPTPVGKSTSTSGKDPGEMSPAEYRVWRAKQYPNLNY